MSKKSFAAILLLTLVSCLSTNSENSSTISIDFNLPESGVVWVGRYTEFVDGKPKIPYEFNTYIWKSDRDDYYNLSWGPYHKTWHIEVIKEGRIIKALETDFYSGGSYMFLQEQENIDEIITANGVVSIIQSVKRVDNYMSWDGVERVALVQKSVVIDGSNGTLEQPENGTYTLSYITTEGIEKTEVFSPGGEMLSSLIIVDKILEYRE